MVLFLIGCQTNSPTELSLNNLFNDHMVLQQDTLVSFWGQATKGVKVSLHSSWGAQATTVADETGNWMVQLNTPKADNKSHTVTVKSKKNTIKIEDVLMGEVWLASGQSNMEMPMKGFRYAKVHELVEGAEEEIANANYPEIRMFTVKRTIAFEPQENIEGNWAVCTPETLGEFSAVAYYFGKKLYQELNVPIGLIHSSWGGSPAESWVRLDLIEKIKGFENTSKRLEIANDPNTPYNKWVAKHTSVKWDSLIEVDNFKWVDKTHLEFLSSDYNDDTWQEAAVTSIGEAFEKDDFNGIGWIRQQLNIDIGPGGGERVASEHSLEDVEGAAAAAATRAAILQSLLAVRVVNFTLLRVGQNFVRRGDLLELLGVAALVGVVLDGSLAVRLLDLRRVRGLADPERVVELSGVAL